MRQVIRKKDMGIVKAGPPGGAVSEIKPDDYLTKVIKYIPSEIVVLYVALIGIANSAIEQLPLPLIHWLIFIVGIIATVLYMWRVAKDNVPQIIISTCAFAVWVFALGGPFVYLSWYNSIYGVLLLPVFTFIVPILGGE